MEIIRTTIRRFIRYDSRLYKKGAAVLNFIAILRKEGFNKWAYITKLKKGPIKRGVLYTLNPISLSLNNLIYPILIRPGTEDAYTIINNVIREEYGHFKLSKDPNWILDAGAYIGDTSAYYLSRFPSAKVISLEPNPDSYLIAKKNLELYGNRVILLQKGLFSDNKSQLFSGGSTGASISSNGFAIDCTTIHYIMEKYQISHFDIVKMDIEGAEEAIFQNRPEDWLKKTGLLIIEIHSSKIHAQISEVLNKCGFTMKKYRSIWYCKPIRR